MEDQERRIVSFQVSAAEAESIEAAAAKEGVSRSEYLRQKLLSPRPEAPTTDIEAMLRHLIYITNCTHGGVYAIAEAAGTLPTKRLREVYNENAGRAARYMAELPKHLARIQDRVKVHQTVDGPTGPA